MGSTQQQLGLLTPAARLDRGVATTLDVDALLAAHAPVAMGVSGGKDSCLLALAVQEHLDAIGHRGPRVLVHADLGRVEWRDSLRVCQRLSDRLDLELVVVRRPSGDMMDRWLSRWSGNVERYQGLSCVKLISPWSSSTARFCTSELKVQPICRDLVRRFRGRTIINAVGIRRQESTGREHTPVAKPQPALSGGGGTRGLNWNAVVEWLEHEVFAFLAARNFTPHEGYTDYGMSRISCAFCVLAKLADLLASSSNPDHHALYREMVDLEILSGFSFQPRIWLADVAPHLLTEELRDALADAKRMAVVRQRAEAQIPDHLLYEKGWPTRLPTWGEAEMLCEVRLQVAAAAGLDGVRFLEPANLIGRYEELMAEARAKAA